MLKKLSFKNFTSFKEAAEISFKFDGNTPYDISEGDDYGTILGIKGSNASGKTNILKVFDFLNAFIAHGYDQPRDEKLKIDSFYNSKNSVDINVEFTSNGSDYEYELKVKEGAVYKEVIFSKPKGRKRRIVEREYNDVLFVSQELSELKLIELRSNVSLINVINNYKFKRDLVDLVNVYTFFYQMIINVNNQGYTDISSDVFEISEVYHQSPALFDCVKMMVIALDESISDIEITSGFSKDGKEFHYPIFQHEHEGKQYYLPLHKESSGTRKLFESLEEYFCVIRDGGLLILDEFDIHYHPFILPELLRLFANKNINAKHAQFIFTSHNSEIMDVLGKYRTVLVNKEENESYCYRLDELPSSVIRNDRKISKAYLEGKLGGSPKIKEINEELIKAKLNEM